MATTTITANRTRIVRSFLWYGACHVQISEILSLAFKTIAKAASKLGADPGLFFDGEICDSDRGIPRLQTFRHLDCGSELGISSLLQGFS